MKCPNCGRPYEENETICSSCGQPLSNAQYTPVISHSARRRKEQNNLSENTAAARGRHQPKKRLKRRLLVLLLVMVLIGGGAGGYFFYINQITRRCEDVVRQIFTMAESMDFSSVDPSYLPESLQENPNIRDYIREYVNTTLEEYQIDELLDAAGIEIDADELCDEILSSASYTITGIQTTYNRCVVSVHTENTDFSTLPDVIAQEIEDNISDSSFWNSLQDFFSSIFSGHSHDEEEDTTEDETESDPFSTLYEDFRETAPSTEADGAIVFGIADGQWTLLSIDEELFYSYYGLSALAE